ncbi:Glycosyl transferase, group 1 [Sterolibacterium denitrificans]|uniref:Glycosyl transferase, group 1 n=1 Tax=Sterolibacterium denitrificans TaxID=157592 RepID=A0A7Z7HQW2_9PROT|nr:glycosyltransferase [Sterolibacterium denitrificans]SMB24541.1 Glycosyl transferase, group 1 [Sterolibacterium denitrificans]
MSSVRPVALLVTPVLPQPGGSGPALRAWDWLLDLARSHRVHVVVTGDLPAQPLPLVYPAEAVHRLSAGTARHRSGLRALGYLFPLLCLPYRGVVADWRMRAGRRAFAQLRPLLPGRAEVARIVAFRFYVHDVALQFAGCFPEAALELDMDDLESQTRMSVAGALWRMGRYGQAFRCAVTALQYALLEMRLTGPYDKVWLAADEDRQHLRTRLSNVIGVRPNRIPLPDSSGETFMPPAAVLRLLFVGTLNYPPNEEAVLALVNLHLPALRRRLGRSLCLCIAGRGASASLAEMLRRVSDVKFVPDAPDLADLYAEAHVVVVPLKAGGGSKLKTLGAFAHRRAVVSTAHGARGFDARAGEHYLLAETPDEFAEAICRLANEPSLARQLASAGEAFCIALHRER